VGGGAVFSCAVVTPEVCSALRSEVAGGVGVDG
jgi:hypothetical protein